MLGEKMIECGFPI